jgi:hypothetical protein
MAMSELTATQVRAGTSIVAREDFGGQEIQQIAETASVAVAAQARAAVEARFVMAIRRPRDWDQVRVSLLKECSRPGFAATARYHKPIGKGVEGPSIRFAEAALRCMTNVLPEVQALYDDATKRIVRVSVTDLEANVCYATDVVLEKTVERSSLKDGQQALGSRINSYGQKVYLVGATEDEISNKVAALISKSIRQNGLRLLPGDILEECMDRVVEVLEKKDAADPDAARKKLADGFAQLGVSPSGLKDYLGHELGACSPAELTELRALWTAIRDGETTWSATIEVRQADRALNAQPNATAATTEPAKGIASLKDRLSKAKEKEGDRG